MNFASLRNANPPTPQGSRAFYIVWPFRMIAKNLSTHLMSTTLWVIAALLLGYYIRYFQNRMNRRKNEFIETKRQKLIAEMVEKSNQMGEIIQEQNEIAGKKAAIFHRLAKDHEQLLDLCESVNENNAELIQKLTKLRAQYERTLATFN